MNHIVVPTPRVGKINLLDTWSLEARARSSPLAPKRQYSRKAVEDIEKVLTSSFPQHFFIHTYGEDGSAWDVNVILRLLMSPKEAGAVVALLEICRLLEYARIKQPKLHTQIKHEASNPVQFQASLYEAYIARAIERTGVVYECGTVTEGKPLDGFFVFQETTCRVECKQPFAPKADEPDVMRRVIDKTILELPNIGVGPCIGIAIRLRRPVHGSVVEEALGMIRIALGKLSFGKVDLTDLTMHGAGCTIDLLPAGILDPGKVSTDQELVARIEVNAENINAGLTATGAVHIGWGFSYSDSEVIDRLRDIIQRARKQHKHRASEKLIVCVDSQEMSDFRFGLLQGNDTLLKEVTQQRIQSVLNNALVVVTRRQYSGPRIAFKNHVFSTDEDKPLAQFLQKALDAA